MPLPVGVLLGVVGAGLLIRRARTWVRRFAGRHGSRGRGLRLLAMVAALVAFAVLLPLLGYVVTSTALFVAAALLLGAPQSGARWRTAGRWRPSCSWSSTG